MRAWRFVLFGVVCAACVVAAAISIAASGSTSVDASAAQSSSSAALSDVVAHPFVSYRSTETGGDFGKLAVARLDDPAAHAVTGLDCERADMVASGGICISAKRGVTTSYAAVLFDRDFHSIWEMPLAGTSSRARISPDGRRAAVTTFVSGDNYAAHTFSTRTVLLDVERRVPIDDLERFAVLKDGEPLSSPDFNFWGVTFARDSNRFYATLATGGHHYLVEGDVNRRQVSIVYDGLECPSLSPDEHRVAFKKRSTDALGRVHWRISVLDLSTLIEHPLAESRSVDDQPAWLDDNTVVYGLPHEGSGTAETDLWAVPADGSGAPRLLVPRAWSPSHAPIG